MIPDPSLRALSTVDDETFAKYVAYREARFAWAEAIGRPILPRAVGGFPASERKAGKLIKDQG